MIRLLLTLFICLLSLIEMSAQNKDAFSRKPNLRKISSKAIELIKKAKSEGTSKNVSNANRSSQTTSNPILDYTQIPTDARVPGQFEESQAVAITWQYGYNADFSMNDEPASDTTPNSFGKIGCDLAAAIQQSAKVIIRIKAAQDSITVKNIMVNRGTPLTNYAFYVHPIDSFWDRDSGPISFYYGAQDNIGMIDNDYYTIAAIDDGNGTVFTDFEMINAGGRINDDLIPVAISNKLGYPLYKSPLNDEGGNIISDGLGRFIGSYGTRTANTTPFSGSLLGLDPNFTFYNNYPILSQTEFSSLYLDTFRIANHIETEAFSCDGGTGHIDIYAKLMDENTFLLTDYTQAIEHTDYEKWNNNLTLLQNIVDSNNKPYNFKLVPMPLDNGNVQTSCIPEDQRNYINGIIVNKSYIMPINSDPANPSESDAAAITAFQNAMPGYTIRPIDTRLMFGSGGLLHCITMQIPAENPIFIQHNAITGIQPLQSFTINALIKNKSGLASQFVYYRKSTSSNWIALPMTLTTADNYTATIPATDLSSGDVIEYYIEATSNNGKTIAKPLVAHEGGVFKFTIDSNLGQNALDLQTNFALNIYPNPTNGSFTLPVASDSFKTIGVEVYDVLGRVVYSEKFEKDSGLLLKEIQFFSEAGIYLVKTTVNGVLVKTQRLIKK